MVVVTSKDRLIISASLKTSDPPIAEETAVALALAQPSGDTVVNDSRTAYGSFHGEGVISSMARAILSKYKPSEKSHRAWIPAHSQAAGNTIAIMPKKCQSGPSTSWKSYHTRLPAFRTLPRCT